ncbi:MAG: hypothetical protein IK062_01865 [Selenomonadaceae bacterium]|nr:hypothetical protein [Selenomonadaceae bacterium]
MRIQVYFKRLDYGNIRFHSVAERMAKFVCNHQEYLFHLAYVIRNSKNWTLKDCQEKLCSYIDPIRPIMTVSNRDEKSDQNYTDILKYSYGLCKKDVDVNILRGVFAEWLFSCSCSTKLTRDWKYEVGCAVEIDGKKVEYRNDATAESKKTVDLGGWNFSEQSGIFAEVKVSPDVFDGKDCGFLQCLRNTLRLYDFVRYKIYVFSLRQKNLMKERIESLGYPLSSDTVILAPDNLFAEKFFAF